MSVYKARKLRLGFKGIYEILSFTLYERLKKYMCLNTTNIRYVLIIKLFIIFPDFKIFKQ